MCSLNSVQLNLEQQSPRSHCPLPLRVPKTITIIHDGLELLATRRHLANNFFVFVVVATVVTVGNYKSHWPIASLALVVIVVVVVAGNRSAKCLFI